MTAERSMTVERAMTVKGSMTVKRAVTVVARSRAVTGGTWLGAALLVCAGCKGGADRGSSSASSAASATGPATSTAGANTGSAQPGGTATFVPKPVDKGSLNQGGPVERPNVKAANDVDFSGNYHSSSGGEASVTRTSEGFGIKYQNGEATCAAAGSVLDCTWTQPDKSGRALFLKTADGTLEGTYGQGDSTSDGGAWALVPVQNGERALVSGVSVAGSYQSSYGGEAIATQDGSTVTIKYKNGEASCVAPAGVLNCAWRQATKSGHALFVATPNGSLWGNWGNGPSFGNGGVWTLTLIKAAGPQGGGGSPPPEPPPPPPAPPPPPPDAPDPYALAADGLPVVIPGPGSNGPTLAEWNAVPREITVRNSSALGCETKMLREWLRVSCRQHGSAVPIDVQEINSSGEQAYLGMYGSTASLVMQVVRNHYYEAAFVWDDNGQTYGANLIVDWRNGVPRPSIYFQ